MKRIIILIISLIFISPCIAQEIGDEIYLSAIGAYRSTFEEVYYNSSSEMKMGNVLYSEGLQFYNSQVNGASNYEAKFREQNAYFNLDEAYTRLTGQIGIDDKSTITNKVTITLLGDDNELQKIAMHPSDLPVYVDLDVSGVRRLTLQVISDDQGAYTTKKLYLDLVDMVLAKQPGM